MWDSEETTSSQTCSLWRKRRSPDNHIELKFGTTYQVRTGYKIYTNDDEVPISEATGETVLMTFESASTLVLAGLTLCSVLTF